MANASKMPFFVQLDYILVHLTKWSTDIAFILAFNLLLSGTPGLDGPESPSGGEYKMAAMVVLLHQSRYCNANHDWIIRWKDFVRFCHFFQLLRRGSWALGAAEDRLHRKMSLGKSHSSKTRFYFGDIFIVMERLQYLQMVWFKFWHQMVEGPAIS